MAISAFFAALGAPLRNRQWSWGAADERNRRVFLRAWRDQIVVPEHGGPRLIRLGHHAKFAVGLPNLGYGERVRHLQLIRDGWHGYIVLCRARDPDARPRSIAGYDALDLLELGGLTEHDGDEFGIVAGARPAADFLID